MQTLNFKNVIIGSGEGGKYLAWHLGHLGEKTAVIERKLIGGSCPNTNCLPSKNEIWSAKVAHLVRHASEYGTNVGPAVTDMAAVRARKRKMVDGLIARHLELYKASGAELIMGSAKFLGPHKLEVQLNDGGTSTVTCERMFLNLGTHAAIPNVPGMAECHPLTHIEALELDRLPEHLIVLGGGYVGLEFAQAYCRFGSKVTIVQRSPQLLIDSDSDVAQELTQLLSDEGIAILTSVNLLKVEGRSGEQVKLFVQTPAGEKIITGSDVLVATGRIPNTAGIGLELAGIRLDENGFLKVNEKLETTAANVWAIGEGAGTPQYTHASFDDFRVIRDNLAGGHRHTRGRLMPSCLFTDPQVAHVGLSEIEARRRGIAVRIAKLPGAAILRAKTTGETRGFMKALIDEKSEKILGFTMVGAEAGEVLSVVQMVMQCGQSYKVLREAIIAHPTMAEGLNMLFA